MGTPIRKETSPQHIRLFAALYPNDEVLAYTRDVMRELDREKRNIRPIPLEQVHLTVKFFGPKVGIGSKRKIMQELRKNKGSLPQPEIVFNKLSLGFPRQKHPRVILLDVEDSPSLHDLVNRLHSITKGLKLRDTIQWKSNNFHDHHISLARLKDSAVNRSTITSVRNLVNSSRVDLPQPFTVEELYLVESTVNSRGKVVYKKLERIDL